MRGDSCCVGPVLGITVFISSTIRSSSGGSSKVDNDTANMISDTISKKSVEQESLAFFRMLNKFYKSESRYPLITMHTYVK